MPSYSVNANETTKTSSVRSSLFDRILHVFKKGQEGVHNAGDQNAASSRPDDEVNAGATEAESREAVSQRSISILLTGTDDDTVVTKADWNLTRAKMEELAVVLLNPDTTESNCQTRKPAFRQVKTFMEKFEGGLRGDVLAKMTETKKLPKKRHIIVETNMHIDHDEGDLTFRVPTVQKWAEWA